MESDLEIGACQSESDMDIESCDESSINEVKLCHHLKRVASLDNLPAHKKSLDHSNINHLSKSIQGIPNEVSRYDKNGNIDGCIEQHLMKFLCADRVTQMTKTYNDIEAVTRLLEEKERDLELAARIGTTLLEKNRDLESRSENLEEQLSAANDKVSQLRHDVSMKDELLRVYCQDLEDDGTNAPQVSPEDGGLSLSVIKVEGLHQKVKSLEDENLTLRLETAQLKSDTSVMEEKEKKLVEDCLQQLAEVNQQVETFAEELSKKSDDNIHQKEEITSLLAKIVDLQKRVRSLTIENMELSKHLQASQESQRKLTKELGMMQDKYDELFEVLEEANEELKVLRRKQRPSGNQSYISSSLFNVPSDSLASELELSMKSEEHPSGLTIEDRRAHSWKVFETAKAAKKAAKKRQEQQSRSTSMMFQSSTAVEFKIGSSRNSSSCQLSDGESQYTSDGYGGDLDSVLSVESDLGRPGIPGSNDLESALKLLALRKANELNEKDFKEDQKKKEAKQAESGMSSPGMARSPSNMSTGSNFSFLSYPGSSNHQHHYKFPEKLQIVKPMEGSATLNKWQQLATPHIGGIFENRPGVQIKGERKLDLDDELYTLSDYEEDDDHSDCPSRRVEENSCVYTYTNSTVKQPDNHNQIVRNCQDDSQASGDISQNSTCVGTSVVMTPMQASTPAKSSKSSNTSSTASGSMSLGLAAILSNRTTSNLDSGVGMRNSISKFNLPLMNARSMSRSSGTSPKRSSPENVTPTNTSPLEQSGADLFNKIKSTGATFMGYLGGAKVNSKSPEAPESSTEPQVKIIDSTSASEAEKSVSSTLLHKSGSSVLGALTSFRRSGIL